MITDVIISCFMSVHFIVGFSYDDKYLEKFAGAGVLTWGHEGVLFLGPEKLSFKFKS